MNYTDDAIKLLEQYGCSWKWRQPAQHHDGHVTRGMAWVPEKHVVCPIPTDARSFAVLLHEVGEIVTWEMAKPDLDAESAEVRERAANGWALAWAEENYPEDADAIRRELEQNSALAESPNGNPIPHGGDPMSRIAALYDHEVSSEQRCEYPRWRREGHAWLAAGVAFRDAKAFGFGDAMWKASRHLRQCWLEELRAGNVTREKLQDWLNTEGSACPEIMTCPDRRSLGLPDHDRRRDGRWDSRLGTTDPPVL